MPKLINLIQGSKEWLAWRKWKIGASMAPAIMGVSPWQTSLQLWESIVLDQSIEKNYAMNRGNSLEFVARDLLNDECPNGLKFSPVCLEHDTIPWMISSMDGAMIVNRGVFTGHCDVLQACEIKCPGKEAHSMALRGEIPSYYFPQVQHQMVVCNLKEILYVSFDGTRNTVLTVTRDDEYITKKLMPALAAFYQSLIDFKPPEPSDKDLIEITNLDALNMAREYSEMAMQIKRLEEKLEPLKEQLCGYATHGRCKIGDLKVTKTFRKGAIDYSRIPELKNVKLDQYRKDPVIAWRIT